MRIVAFHVDGFGLLDGVDVEDVGEGVTVVLGPNESGKSTLHAFLARTLLGFPRRNDARGRRRLAPLAGGHHGGWVAVEDDDGGRWVVHRSTTRSPRLRVVRPDGSERTGHAALAGLVPDGVDLDRFEQVHAIDLDALTGLGALEGTALQDLLFDAATVGAGRSLRAARSAADDARDALWTPQATTRPLAVALRDRDEARAALHAARSAAQGFVALRAERDRLARTVEDLGAERTGHVVEQTLLARVIEAWPVQQELDEAARRARSLGGGRLPDGVADEARAAERDRLAAGEEVARLEHAVASMRAGEGPTALEADLAAVADHILAVHARLRAHGEDVERLRRAEGALRTATGARDDALGELGPGWDLDRVAGVRTDATAREQLAAAATTLLDAQRALEVARQRHDELDAVARRRRAALRRRRDGRPVAPSGDDVRRAEEAVAVLRGAVPLIDRATLRPASASAVGRPFVALVLVVVALVVAAVTLGDDLPAGVLVGVVLVVALPTGMLLGGARSRPSSGAGAVSSGIRIDVDAATARLGLRPPATLADVERAATQTALDRAALDRADRLDEELTALGDELAAAEDAARDAAVTLAEAHGAVDRATDGWRRDTATLGVPDELSPRVTTTLHTRVVDVARAEAAVERVADERDDREVAVRRYRAEVADLLDRAGVDVGVDEDPVGVLGPVAARVRGAAHHRTTDAAVQARREQLGDELDHARAKLQRAVNRRDDALTSAGVDGLAALASRAAEDRARRAAADDLADAEARLTVLLGTGAGAIDARAVLDEGDPIAWETRRVALTDRVAAVEEARDDALREHTRLAARVEVLGGDDAVPRAAQRLAAAQTAVDDLAEQWVVADGAARLLGEAVRSFERDRHPRVLVSAGRLLATATLGEWSRLRQLDGVLVASRPGDDDPVPVDHLSRGTQEQLYLCLRLALAEDRSAVDGVSLPLLVDDLLGSTDPERAAAVARLVADAARSRQVWLFTCDPAAASVVTEAAATARVLRLDRGARRIGWAGEERAEVVPSV